MMSSARILIYCYGFCTYIAFNKHFCQKKKNLKLFGTNVDLFKTSTDSHGKCEAFSKNRTEIKKTPKSSKDQHIVKRKKEIFPNLGKFKSREKLRSTPVSSTESPKPHQTVGSVKVPEVPENKPDPPENVESSIIEKADISKQSKKPYACNLCPRSFTHQAILKGHIILEHTGDNVFSCPACKDKFIYQKSFDKHMAEEHLQSASKRMNELNSPMIVA